MNNEQQQIIDEAYESFMLQNGFKYENGLLAGKMGGLNQLNVTYWLSKEEFINKCKTEDALSIKWIEEYGDLRYGSKEEIEHLSKHYKTDPEFSEKWGLKIEERELSYDIRFEIFVLKNERKFDWTPDKRITTNVLDELNIPTKLITVTYKEQKIESYE